tara:strand:- start:297 stop:554 length:258 start_codon:yes stop_codon:yes gene_type:complete
MMNLCISVVVLLLCFTPLFMSFSHDNMEGSIPHAKEDLVVDGGIKMKFHENFTDDFNVGKNSVYSEDVEEEEDNREINVSKSLLL